LRGRSPARLRRRQSNESSILFTVLATSMVASVKGCELCVCRTFFAAPVLAKAGGLIRPISIT